MRATPLAIDERFPTLELSHANGDGFSLETLLAAGPMVVYFMRTPTCPVCHSHLRQIARTTRHGASLARRTLVVVPGGPEDADAVARRHPDFSDRVVGSLTAHEAAGLFVRGGLQQSGTFVVAADGGVIASRAATVPIGSYNGAEVEAALASVGA